MKILLTNDDGFDAPGIQALANVAKEFGEVFVAAPDRQYSGCGHQITFTDPVEVVEVRPGMFRVGGTPADCVRVGTSQLVDDIDWVIAGINQGSNLGNDVFMSGTIAAAREGAWLGFPSIAISQYHRPNGDHLWDWSEKLCRSLLEKFLQEKPQQFKFWSINFPAVPEAWSADLTIPSIRVCELDPTPTKAEYRADGRAFLMTSDYHARPHVDGHDVDVCFNGEISVTLV